MALQVIGGRSLNREEPGCAHRGEERFSSVSGQQAAGKGRRDVRRRALLISVMTEAAAAPHYLNHLRRNYEYSWCLTLHD